MEHTTVRSTWITKTAKLLKYISKVRLHWVLLDLIKSYNETKQYEKMKQCALFFLLDMFCLYSMCFR